MAIEEVTGILDLMDGGSEKAKNFLVEFDVLCKKHKVQISVSDYDSIEIWDLHDGEQTVYCPCIDDETKQG